MFRFLFLAIFSISIFTTSFLYSQQKDLDLYINSELGKIGDVVNLKVKVNGFTDIIACQGSINWDPTLLKFISVSDFGIKYLGLEDFGTTAANQGHLRFAWDPNDAIAVTAADSAILFSAQFEIIATQNQSIAISFMDITSNPAFINEFADSNYNLLPLNTFQGIVTAVADFKDLVKISSTPDKSCDKKNPSGSLKADVNNDSLSYTFHWFYGNTVTPTPDYIGYRYNNLAAGAYTLQVFDGNNAIFVESISASVPDESNYQSDVITIISNTPQTTCSNLTEKQTGAIEIIVKDAQPLDTYLISWWKGGFKVGTELTDFQDSYIAENLMSGGYEIAIENKATGCMSYQTETITDDHIAIQLSFSSTSDNFCEGGANGSATVAINNPNISNARYYWFNENDAIDTTKARYQGTTFDQLSHGAYTAWVIDLASECFAVGNVTIAKEEIYTETSITQQGSTLIANDERANWFRGTIFLQQTGTVLSPDQSGYYHITLYNEYNCLSISEDYYFGITGFDEVDAEISIFPNPFNDYIRVSNRDGLLEFIKVFDTRGSLISENYSIKNKFIDIYLSGSSDGIYLVQLRKDGKMFTRKVIKNLSK